jgi:hypothetical protein
MDGGNTGNAGAITSGPPWMAEILVMQDAYTEVGGRKRQEQVFEQLTLGRHGRRKWF